MRLLHLLALVGAASSRSATTDATVAADGRERLYWLGEDGLLLRLPRARPFSTLHYWSTLSLRAERHGGTGGCQLELEEVEEASASESPSSPWAAFLTAPPHRASADAHGRVRLALPPVGPDALLHLRCVPVGVRAAPSPPGELQVLVRATLRRDDGHVAAAAFSFALYLAAPLLAACAASYYLLGLAAAAGALGAAALLALLRVARGLGPARAPRGWGRRAGAGAVAALALAPKWLVPLLQRASSLHPFLWPFSGWASGDEARWGAALRAAAAAAAAAAAFAAAAGSFWAVRQYALDAHGAPLPGPRLFLTAALRAAAAALLLSRGLLPAAASASLAAAVLLLLGGRGWLAAGCARAARLAGLALGRARARLAAWAEARAEAAAEAAEAAAAAAIAPAVPAEAAPPVAPPSPPSESEATAGGGVGRGRLRRAPSALRSRSPSCDPEASEPEYGMPVSERTLAWRRAEAVQRASSGESPGVIGSLELLLRSPEFAAWKARTRGGTPRVEEEEEEEEEG